MTDKWRRLCRDRFIAKVSGLTPDADLTQPMSEAEIVAHVAAMRRNGTGENMIRDKVASWRRLAPLAVSSSHEEATRIAAMGEHARFAIANTEIEGGTITPETRALMDAWVREEIDDEELMRRTLERYGAGA